MDETFSGVGLSRKWDSFDAGKEVALDLIRNMNGKTPKFILVYSTIHFMKYGGFQKLLDGIYSIVPKETQLVGGTTAGFIVPQGCYTRGVAAFGILSSQMDISIAVAHNIKRNPEGAAQNCANKINGDFEQSKYRNKFLLNLPSGITTPKIPGFPDNLRVIRSKALSQLLLIGTRLSLLLLQKGPGREEVIIATLAKILPNYKMIGGSFVDDNKGYFNFQFYNKNVYTNVLINVGISTDFGISVNSGLGQKERSAKFKITKKSIYDLVIEKINGKDALGEMLKILNWPNYFMEDSARILRRTFYTPIGYTINGKRYISVMAFIFGESIMISPKIACEEACIMGTSGRQLIDVVDEGLDDTKNKDIKFGLITSCIARLETLGANVYLVHEKLLKHFKGKPFIQMYAVGEDVYTKELGAKRIAESYNTAIFFESGLGNNK